MRYYYHYYIIIIINRTSVTISALTGSPHHSHHWLDPSCYESLSLLS